MNSLGVVVVVVVGVVVVATKTIDHTVLLKLTHITQHSTELNTMARYQFARYQFARFGATRFFLYLLPR